ncbi:hypothetical protein [Neorhizobium sp. T25_27]|uniref:hypothetical protein n=1 Tax=Neorhizobium sp. T25_27 TaxID=2093831 RepID=UPI00155EAECF|nr:hypothetical protein [Neorhizobium sp. T25_27]
MDSAASTSTWTVLLPVIIGGVIAAIGGAIGPFLAHLLTSRASKQQKRNESFEKIIEAVYEHDHWLTEKRNVVVFGEVKDLPPEPIYKAVSIALIHFPELMEKMQILNLKSDHYLIWMGNAGLKRLKNEIESLNEGGVEAYRAYAESRLDFLSAGSKYVADRYGRV